MLISQSHHEALKVAKELLPGAFCKAVSHQLRAGHAVVRVWYDAAFNFSSVEAKVRNGLDAIDWQFITDDTKGEQHDGKPLGCFDMAPIGLKIVRRVYHTTTNVKIDLILNEGLLPSNDERSTTSWPDTEGRIHACEKLTCPEGKNDSAEWWMQKLSKKANQRIADWGILEINLAAFSSARTH